jgi:hypothetical protein
MQIVSHPDATHVSNPDLKYVLSAPNDCAENRYKVKDVRKNSGEAMLVSVKTKCKLQRNPRECDTENDNVDELCLAARVRRHLPCFNGKLRDMPWKRPKITGRCGDKSLKWERRKAKKEIGYVLYKKDQDLGEEALWREVTELMTAWERDTSRFDIDPDFSMTQAALTSQMHDWGALVDEVSLLGPTISKLVVGGVEKVGEIMRKDPDEYIRTKFSKVLAVPWIKWKYGLASQFAGCAANFCSPKDERFSLQVDMNRVGQNFKPRPLENAKDSIAEDRKNLHTAKHSEHQQCARGSIGWSTAVNTDWSDDDAVDEYMREEKKWEKHCEEEPCEKLYSDSKDVSCECNPSQRELAREEMRQKALDDDGRADNSLTGSICRVQTYTDGFKGAGHAAESSASPVAPDVTPTATKEVDTVFSTTLSFSAGSGDLKDLLHADIAGSGVLSAFMLYGQETLRGVNDIFGEGNGGASSGRALSKLGALMSIPMLNKVGRMAQFKRIVEIWSHAAQLREQTPDFSYQTDEDRATAWEECYST